MRLIRTASSIGDALIMRRARNACRTFMTRDQRKISHLRQLWWWFNLDQHKYRPYVVGRDFGYALVVLDVSKAWLTAGLLPEHRGRGLGERVFRELVDETIVLGYEPWLEVLESNRPARCVYEKLGFEEVERREGALVMKR